MTISSINRKAGPYVGNGTASVFPFAFKVFQASDLEVVRLTVATNVETILALTTDYTVALNQDQDSNPGGSITLVAGALATGFNLVITSDVENLQPTDLTNQGGFYPDVINDALDRATIQIQQLQEGLDRAAQLPITSAADSAALVADILRLADSADNLDIDANNIGAINTVATNITNVNTVATNVASVNTTAGAIANVNITAANISSVNTNAANIVEIQNASNNAIIATTKASESSASAASANASAGVATTKAAESSASASSASASAAIATTKAAESSTLAGVATTKAGEASVSADSANTSAGVATTQAGIATAQATIATTKAAEASDSAAAAAATKVLVDNSLAYVSSITSYKLSVLKNGGSTSQIVQINGSTLPVGNRAGSTINVSLTS